MSTLADKVFYTGVDKEEAREVVQVWQLPTRLQLEIVPRPPSLRHTINQVLHDDESEESYDLSNLRDLSELGKMVAMVPGEDGYVAQFIQHPGHPQSSTDGASVHLAVSVSQRIADIVVNGGVLSGSDNIVYGEMREGVLFAMMAFVEVEE